MGKQGVHWTEDQFKAALAKRPDLAPSSAVAVPRTASGAEKGVTTPKKGRGRKQTRTEGEYELMLKRDKSEGRILEYGFQKITLWLADDCRYTPDFHVINNDGLLLFIEIKGQRAWEDSIVKFKTARELFPHFTFKLIQKTADGWVWLH